MKELQTRRFTEQIQEILGDECRVKPVIDESGILHSAKIHTKVTLDSTKLNALMGTADAWNCEPYLDRSSDCIRIQFENNVNAVMAN